MIKSPGKVHPRLIMPSALTGGAIGFLVVHVCIVIWDSVETLDLFVRGAWIQIPESRMPAPVQAVLIIIEWTTLVRGNTQPRLHQSSAERCAIRRNCLKEEQRIWDVL